MLRRLAPLLVSAVALCGCVSLAPKDRRPASPVPPSWPQGAAYAPNTAAPGGATAADLAWRDVFTDPKLSAVIGQALANNRDLRVAVLNVEQSRAQYRVQRAALYPTVKGTLSYEHQQAPVAAFGVPGQGSLSFDLYSLSAGVSAYELDLFGRVRSLTRSALERYLATDEARRAAQIALISEVADNYFVLAADRERLKVATDTLRVQQAEYDLVKGRFDHGVASELDLSQSETSVDQARSNVASLTALAAQDLNALNLVVGANVGEDQLASSVGDLQPIRADLPAGVSSAVLLERPDVLEAEHALRAGNADIGAARAAFFPTLALTGSGGVESAEFAELFKPGSGAWSFTPNLTAPIFDWGANRARLGAAKAERDIAVAQYEKAIQTAFREVADALARRGTIGTQLASDQANVTASAKALELARARYNNGVDPYLTTLVAQNALYAAQQNLITTEFIHWQNAVALYQALGGGAH